MHLDKKETEKGEDIAARKAPPKALFAPVFF